MLFVIVDVKNTWNMETRVNLVLAIKIAPVKQITAHVDATTTGKEEIQLNNAIANLKCTCDPTSDTTCKIINYNWYFLIKTVLYFNHYVTPIFLMAQTD